MEKERTYKMVACISNIVAILAGLMVILSMFMPYLKINVGDVSNSLGSGFKFLTGKNTSGKIMAYLVLCLIFALSLLVFGIMRVIKFPLFNTKLFSALFALIGVGLIILSVLTFTAFKDTSGLDITKHGMGLIINLVFSILGVIAAITGAAATTMFHK